MKDWKDLTKRGKVWRCVWMFYGFMAMFVCITGFFMETEPIAEQYTNEELNINPELVAKTNMIEKFRVATEGKGKFRFDKVGSHFMFDHEAQEGAIWVWVNYYDELGRIIKMTGFADDDTGEIYRIVNFEYVQ